MEKLVLFSVLLIIGTLCQCYEGLKLKTTNVGIRGNGTRFKRQANTCKTDSTKFQCETNPDCIENDRQCDGKEDCPDGSDEKQSLCQNLECPGYLFQCEYGACISQYQRCDGVKDCKDNSDEAGCPSAFEKINTNCRSDEFTCDNGQCINTDSRCNGVAECEDKSDETEELCLNIECPGYTYKCRYGACVDGTAKCNGIKECFDNSDEDEKTCGHLTPSPPDVTPSTGGPSPGGTSRKCITPPQPANGNWEYFNDEFQSPQTNQPVPPKTQIIFRCNDKFRLSTGHDREEEIVYCRGDGQWSKTVFPECLRLCDKYYNRDHVIVHCKLDESTIPCDKATSGTQLTFKCDQYYEPLSTYLLNVCRDGVWTYEAPKCTEVCGQKQVQAETLVIGGQVVKRGHYPWVVALYSNKDSETPSKFTNICGGSLLSPSIVLTAAHCVSEQKLGKPYPIKYYRVGAGKYFNSYMDDKDNDTAQYLKIKTLVKHNDYRGEKQNFAYDIALLKLEAPFALSKVVQPIKTLVKHNDYRGEKQNFAYDIALLKLEAPFALSKVVQPVCLNGLPDLNDHGIATATGWGYTTSSGKPSDVLKEIDLEYVDNEKCRTELDTDFADQYLIPDKLCAGHFNKSIGVCQGDSGGGLVVRHTNDRYFVQGVVSLAHSFLGNNLKHCNIQRRALFTRVHEYLAWIAYNVQLL